MKKNAFTLMELLAVIVILAIISLIATPKIINIISVSKRTAFVLSAEQILKEGKKYYLSNKLNMQASKQNMVIEFPEAKELELEGKKTKMELC